MKESYAPIELCRIPERYPVFFKIFQEKVEHAQIISRHWHTNIELTYRRKYKGKLYMGNEMYPLEDESLYIINIREIHEIHKYPQEELYAILVSIPCEYVKALIPEADRYYFQVGTHENEMKKQSWKWLMQWKRKIPSIILTSAVSH